jgi:uncharacterized glyoxalase superfamily protein PhnB
MQQTIFPALRYSDARQAVAFLATAFGFERQSVFEGGDGTVAHAELRLGTAAVAVSSATPETPDNPWTSVRAGVYAVLADRASVDAVAARASAAGARIAQPPRDTDYGSHECSIWDVGGHLWSFGTYTWAAPGDPSLSVALQYGDAAGALEWLERVFGLRPGLTVHGEGGTIAHAERYLAASVLMVGSASDGAGWAGQRQSTCITVADPDGHHARAVAAGASIVAPLADTEYGARGYTAVDPDGFVWTFTTYRPTPPA